MSRAERANVIGLELAGTGVQYDAAMAEIMKAATATQRPTGLRELLWQPAELYPPDVLTGMTNSSTGALYEVGMTKNWPRQDFPALAPHVRVPVQFSVAEYERVWRSDPEALAADRRHVHRVAAIRDQRAIRYRTQHVAYRCSAAAYHAHGAVVRRGMRCRAEEHI